MNYDIWHIQNKMNFILFFPFDEEIKIQSANAAKYHTHKLYVLQTIYRIEYYGQYA